MLTSSAGGGIREWLGDLEAGAQLRVLDFSWGRSYHLAAGTLLGPHTVRRERQDGTALGRKSSR